jgi:hypothetical protein
MTARTASAAAALVGGRRSLTVHIVRKTSNFRHFLLPHEQSTPVSFRALQSSCLGGVRPRQNDASRDECSHLPLISCYGVAEKASLA